MLPQRTVSRPTFLQFACRLLSPRPEFFVSFTPPAGGRVNFCQFSHGDRWLFRIWAAVVSIEIRHRRVTILKLHNNLTDRQSPVPHVNVTQGIVAQETA